jgi:hypothetical protein
MSEEQLIELLQSLPEEKRQEFLNDVAELMKLNVAYLDKAKSLGILK